MPRRCVLVVRPTPSTWFSRLCTPARSTRTSWPTTICRNFPRSPREVRTRYGSSPRKWVRPCKGWVAPSNTSGTRSSEPRGRSPLLGGGLPGPVGGQVGTSPRRGVLAIGCRGLWGSSRGEGRCVCEAGTDGNLGGRGHPPRRVGRGGNQRGRGLGDAFHFSSASCVRPSPRHGDGFHQHRAGPRQLQWYVGLPT